MSIWTSFDKFHVSSEITPTAQCAHSYIDDNLVCYDCGVVCTEKVHQQEAFWNAGRCSGYRGRRVPVKRKHLPSETHHLRALLQCVHIQSTVIDRAVEFFDLIHLDYRPRQSIRQANTYACVFYACVTLREFATWNRIREHLDTLGTVTNATMQRSLKVVCFTLQQKNCIKGADLLVKASFR